MSRLGRHTVLGLRWLDCGWRLFLLNPWQLGGMGGCCVVLVAVLAQIPFVGGALIALVAPLLLASIYLVIDVIATRNVRVPATLGLAALRQSPHDLLGVFRREEHLVAVVAMGFLSMAGAVLIVAAVSMIAGRAWITPWADLGVSARATLVGATLVAGVLYFLLALPIIYAPPRLLFRREPLASAIRQSFRAGLHYLYALLVLLAFLVAPVVLGVVVSFFSSWGAHAIAMIVGTMVLPVTATSLYCSYRMIFSARPDGR